MTKLRVIDLANVRLRAPDLDAAQKFSEAFGLPTVDRQANLVCSRATDAGPRCHFVELGEPAFLGSAFLAASPQMLADAATIEGAGPVEPTGEPGGGHRVRLTDPDGFWVDIVHGVELLPAISVKAYPINTAAGRRRPDGTFFRRDPGPSHVKRLGHYVTSTPNVKRTRAWYRETLGLIATDDVFAGSEDNVIATFSRLARGKEYVDHHVFMTHQAPHTALNHFGFEAQDYDDIFFGHYHMKDAGMEHRWGIGRHHLGSQVYNQWSDPWGRGYEHWTDTDVLNEDYQPELVPASLALKSQWGEPLPAAKTIALDEAAADVRA